MDHQIIRRQYQSDPQGLPESLHPVLRRVYANRGVENAEGLELGLKKLERPTQLPDLEVAVSLLVNTLTNDGNILIIGDFDADGATSSALAVRALRAMGASHVGFLVPNRFEYGYGLTPEIVAVAARQKPELLITVDNGVSSVDGVAAAKRLGIKVLITDHHLAGRQLPAADAIVNPNLPNSEFGSKNLAGVGVIFYLLSALRTRLSEQDWFDKQGLKTPNMADYLDLVALGTVADVVPLDRNNRVLVDQGLRRIRAGRCCPGILALADVAKRSYTDLVASDMGFGIAPRLNAAGRLDDMSVGINCLLTDDSDYAHSLAVQLDKLNLERRSIEAQMQAEAMEYLTDLEFDSDTLPTGLCLFDADWHQGVIGILAARVRERYHRPTIIFAADGEDREGNALIKGSARSVPGLHIRDALDAVATQNPSLIHKFGGHAMAAGLGLKQDDLDAFKAAFDQQARQFLNDDDLHGVIHSDGQLPAQDINLLMAETLRQGGPWGQHFPEPIFDGHFKVLSRRQLSDGKHLKMMLSADGRGDAVDAIVFNYDGEIPEQGATIELAYRLDVNEYQDLRSVQLMVDGLWL